MKWLAPVVIVAMFICSCNWDKTNPVKAEITKDTLAYNYKTLRQRANDCGSKADSACTVIKITYPEFKNAAILNDTVLHKAITYFPLGEVADTSFKALSANFIKSYKQDKKLTGREGMFFTIDTKATVLRQDSGLTTLQLNGYQFTGGAHGGSALTFINWDTKRHKQLKLADILNPGFNGKLNAVAEQIFRKQENLTDTSSLSRDYFFKDDKFSLNNNFLITPLGLRFVYNEYEIKPYAAGQTDMLIPYSKIKTLINLKSIVAQFLN